MTTKRKSSSPGFSAGSAKKKSKPTVHDLAPTPASSLSATNAHIYKTVQRATCNTPKVPLERCVSCVQKQPSLGPCRFINIRAFRTETSTSGKDEVVYADYVMRSNRDDTAEEMEWRPQRKKKSIAKPEVPHAASSLQEPERPSPSVADADYTLPLIATTFANHVERELRHEETHASGTRKFSQVPDGPRPYIRIQDTPEMRSVCDHCVTAIWMGSYMCACCGKEFCIGCYEEWVPSGPFNRARRDACTWKRNHKRRNMFFVTRAAEGELSRLLSKVKSREPGASTSLPQPVIRSMPTITAPSWEGGPNYLPVPTVERMSLPEFRLLWREGGVPLVLKNQAAKFKLGWDPDFMIAHYGKSACEIGDCINGTSYGSTVKAFFESFHEDSRQSLKLKDWPPTSEFKKTFPELFEDFEQAVPFPTYTRRTGALNLASYFPPNHNAPDLGPKMYNAYPAPDFLPLPDNLTPDERQEWLLQRARGTTNLHLDLTDAVNIMLYAAGGENAPIEKETEKMIPLCGAIWDIFPPSTASEIRAFLLEQDASVDDPIHRQSFYLDEEDLAALAKRGVGCYRIYQNPGDAVFIPAGCPHQVRNRQSCIKVAVDFLSPENVSVAKGLQEEARQMTPLELGMGNIGKEDVLQLWSCLGFAWEALEKVGMDGIPSPRSPPQRQLQEQELKTGAQNQRPLTISPLSSKSPFEEVHLLPRSVNEPEEASVAVDPMPPPLSPSPAYLEVHTETIGPLIAGPPATNGALPNGFARVTSQPAALPETDACRIMRMEEELRCCRRDMERNNEELQCCRRDIERNSKEHAEFKAKVGGLLGAMLAITQEQARSVEGEARASRIVMESLVEEVEILRR